MYLEKAKIRGRWLDSHKSLDAILRIMHAGVGKCKFVFVLSAPVVPQRRQNQCPRRSRTCQS